MKTFLFLILAAAGLSACSTAQIRQNGGKTSAVLTEPGPLWDGKVEVKNLDLAIPSKAQEVPYKKMHVIGKLLKLPNGGTVRFFSVNGEKLYGGIISPRNKIVAVKCRDKRCIVLSPSSDKTVIDKERVAALALFLAFHVVKPHWAPSWMTGAKSAGAPAPAAAGAPMAAAAPMAAVPAFPFVPF